MPTDRNPTYELAPAFDNGSSLGFVVRDADIPAHLEADRLRRFVDRGTHHYGWLSWDRESARHSKLCVILAERHASIAPIMARIGSISDGQVEAIVRFCTGFDFPVRFSEQRAEFAFAQIKARRTALMRSLGG